VTFEAQFAPGAHRVRVRTAEENERAFLSATSHSRLVAILRKALPALAVVVFAGYFISTRLNVTVGGVTASVSGIEVADGKLRMVNPTLKGVDKKKGAYVVSADYADQDMTNPKLVNLHAIKAQVTSGQNGWSRMQATRGLFDTERERLVMQDDIRVSTSSGITGKLTHASLNMNNQILRAHQRVMFDLPNGSVRANAMTLDSAEKTLTFRGKVHVHIVKTAANGAAAPPQIKAPAAPDRVAPGAVPTVSREAAPSP
jgi:lipopolysaccharide export system protein LptC